MSYGVPVRIVSDGPLETPSGFFFRRHSRFLQLSDSAVYSVPPGSLWHINSVTMEILGSSGAGGSAAVRQTRNGVLMMESRTPPLPDGDLIFCQWLPNVSFQAGLDKSAIHSAIYTMPMLADMDQGDYLSVDIPINFTGWIGIFYEEYS